jgi:hypothetical protein
MAEPLDFAGRTNGDASASAEQYWSEGTGPAKQSEPNPFSVSTPAGGTSVEGSQPSPGSIGAFDTVGETHSDHGGKQTGHGGKNSGRNVRPRPAGATGRPANQQLRRASASRPEKQTEEPPSRSGGIWEVLDKPVAPEPAHTPPSDLQRRGGIWDALDQPVAPEPARTRARPPSDLQRAGGIWDVLDQPVRNAAPHDSARRPSHHAAHGKSVSAPVKQPVIPPPGAMRPPSAQPNSAAGTTHENIAAALNRNRSGNPVQASASPRQDTIAQSQADPTKALHAIRPDDLKSDDNVAAYTIINRFVAWAAAQLGEKQDVPQANVNDAMLRLEQGTKGLDPSVAAAVVKQFLAGNRGLAAFYRANQDTLQNDQLYVRDRDGFGDGPGGNPSINIGLFITIADLIAGAPEGDGVVSSLAAVGGWPRWPGGRYVSQAIGNGAGLAYALACARKLEKDGADPSPVYKAISAGLDRFSDKTEHDYQALLAHRCTLALIIQDIAPVATPEQLNEVTAAFFKDHPDWKQKDNALQRRLSDDGTSCMRYLVALESGGDSPAVAQLFKRLLRSTDREAVRVAMSMAIRIDPGLNNPNSPLFRRILSFLHKSTSIINPATRSFVELARKLTGEIAAQVVHGRLISVLRNTEDDLGALFVFKKQLSALAKEFKFLGVSKAAIDDVERLSDEVWEIHTRDCSRAVRTDALKKFYKKLDTLKAFNADTPAGQAMRAFASALAVAGMAISLKNALDDPTAFNVAKSAIDTLSAVQRISDLLRSLGVENSVVQGMAGGWKIALRAGAKIGAAELFTLASAMFEGVKAVDSFAKGDTAGGIFSGGIFAGGTISVLPAFGASSMAGPVGIAIMTAFFAGQIIWLDAKHVHDGEDDVRKGLIALGYKPELAAILCQRGGYGSGYTSGKGQMLALMNYAKAKGMDARQLRDWINSLSPVQARHLSELVLYETGAGNANVRFDPDEAKKQSAYVIPPGAGAARYGFPASSAVGKSGLRRRTAADFEQGMIRNFIPPPFFGTRTVTS